MSTVITVIANNGLHDIHSLLLDVQNKTPGMLYRFGEDKSKYNPGFYPDVYTWIHQKSTRMLDLSIERNEMGKWHFNIRVPVCSNCILWQLAFTLIEKIATATNGKIYTAEMDMDEEEGLTIKQFEQWKAGFFCGKKLASEINTTITFSEFNSIEPGSTGDVTIFGPHAPYTFNTNIIRVLKGKKSPSKEFEKRMLQLQNACIDEAYRHVSDIIITSKAGKECKAKICSGIPFQLIINDEIDSIVFTSTLNSDVFMVPAKKVRAVMPAHCFFDEYSFYVDNSCFAEWDNIMQKAKALHEEI